MVFSVCQTSRCRTKTNLDKEGYCPTCIKKRDALAKDNIPWPCGKCSKNCDDENSSLECEFCFTWHHAVCVDVPLEGYKWMKKLSGARWFCSQCNSKLDKLVEKANSLEVETKILRSDVDQMNIRLETVEKKLEGSVKKEIGTALNEQVDIEKRKMNLLVFNLPEPENVEQTVWDIPTKVAKDTKAISDIIKDNLKINLPDGQIINARRLGTLDTESESAKNGVPKPRPLKITFSDISKKRDVLTAAKNLRTSDNDIAKKLYINPDLTPEQRKSDQVLRQEMWRRRTENNENVIIRKGEIVTASWEVRKKRSAVRPTTSSM